MSVYCRITAIESGTSYKVGKNDDFSQLFASNFTGSGGVLLERDKSGDILSSCGLCYALKPKKGFKISQFLNNRGRYIICMDECLRKNEVSQTDHKEMIQFIETSDMLFSGPGLHLNQRVRNKAGYYKEVEISIGFKKFCNKRNGFVPSIDNYLNNFLLMYLYKDGNHRRSLMFPLLNIYVSKASINQNPEYRTKFLDLLLALSDSDNIDFEFVSTNICSIYLRHMNHISSAYRERPFNFHDKDDIIELVGKQVANICHYFGNKSMHVAISLGVDTTIIVRGCQIIRHHNKIIGGT